MPNERFRCRWIRCGKCNRCPHGPYWYAYWYEAGKQRSRYIGRELPAGNTQDRPEADSWDAIFSERTASPGLAYEILGVGAGRGFPDVRRAYREFMDKNHPDKGGSEQRAKQANCAFEYLRARLR